MDDYKMHKIVAIVAISVFIEILLIPLFVPAIPYFEYYINQLTIFIIPSTFYIALFFYNHRKNKRIQMQNEKIKQENEQKLQNLWINTINLIKSQVLKEIDLRFRNLEKKMTELEMKINTQMVTPFPET